MKNIWSSLCGILLTLGLQAQDLEERLYEAGFENVQLQEKADTDTLQVFFEHREFRSPYHSMRYASLLLPEIRDKTLLWVPLYHNEPIGKFSAGNLDFQPLTQEDRRFFRKTNSLSEGYRYHFRIRPDFSAKFGYYSDPFQVKFNMILDSRIYLAPGLSVQTGISIPIENNLDVQDMKPRLAPSMLHYFTQPINAHFLGISLGTFHYDRYGIDFQYRYAPLDSRWSFGLESGLTGFHWLNAGSFYSEPLNDLYAIADVEYRLPIENLTAKVSAGQFLFDDKAVRVDLIRQFGTVDVGLHAAVGEAGSTAGFQFAFSLFPGKIYRNRKLELRTTEEFRWEYSYNNEAPVAQRFRIGMPRLSDMLRQYNEHFFEGL